MFDDSETGPASEERQLKKEASSSVACGRFFHQKLKVQLLCYLHGVLKDVVVIRVPIVLEQA
jgi:hypothetical protein